MNQLSGELIESINYINYNLNPVLGKSWHGFLMPQGFNPFYVESKIYHVNEHIVYFAIHEFRYICSRCGTYLFVLGYDEPISIDTVPMVVLEKVGGIYNTNATLLQIRENEGNVTFSGFSDNHVAKFGNWFVNLNYNNLLLSFANMDKTFIVLNLPYIGIVPKIKPKSQWVYSRIINGLVTSELNS